MKLFNTIAAAGLSLGLTAGLVGPGLADATLMVGSWTSSNDPFSLAIDDYKARVAEASGGDIVLETTYDGQIVSLRTALSGVRDGVVDIALLAGLLTPTETRMEAVIMDHPTISLSNPYAIAGAVLDFANGDCELCREELEAQNIKPLAYLASSPFYMMCREPMESMDQFKGQAMRGVVAYSRFIQYLGGVPVYTSPTELQEAMQRGQVTCAIGAAVWLSAYGLGDVVNYVIDLPLGQAPNNLFGINIDAWENLSEEDRRVLVDNLPYLVRRSGDHNVQVLEQVRASSIENGTVWAAPSPEFEKAFEDFRALDHFNVVEAAEEKGIDSAELLVRSLGGYAEKWNALIAETDGNAEAIEKLYAEHLYGG